jgi:hypothetical protein
MLLEALIKLFDADRVVSTLFFHQDFKRLDSTFVLIGEVRLEERFQDHRLIESYFSGTKLRCVIA